MLRYVVLLCWMNHCIQPPTECAVSSGNIPLQQELALLAGNSLVNLSQDLSIAESTVKLGGVQRVMELLSKPTQPTTRICVMLLVNLTQSEEGSSIVLQVCHH